MSESILMIPLCVIFLIHFWRAEATFIAAINYNAAINYIQSFNSKAFKCIAAKSMRVVDFPFTQF